MRVIYSRQIIFISTGFIFIILRVIRLLRFIFIYVKFRHFDLSLFTHYLYSNSIYLLYLKYFQVKNKRETSW